MTETQTVSRATPAEPWPGTANGGLPSSAGRSLPPELGAGAIAVLDGVSFMYSDVVGDVPAGSIGGLVHADTRLLSTWVLTLNGERLLPLRSDSVEHYSAAFFLTNPDMPGAAANEFGVRRLRSVDSRLNERIEVWCFARTTKRVEIRLRVGNDFADLFEIKDVIRDRTHQISRRHSADGSALVFDYHNGQFWARTRVETFPPATRLDGDDLVWEVELAPDAEWAVDIAVPFATGMLDESPMRAWPTEVGPGEVGPIRRGFGRVMSDQADDPTTRWFSEVPTLDSDSRPLVHIVEQTARDLMALRVVAKLEDRSLVLPAAGLPWFLTVFGRDTLITAYQTIAFGQELARGALIELAALQGTVCDDFRDEEPGKILHEIRQGELTKLGLKPHSPYYGTADATMLWLILFSEHWRWTGDDNFVLQLWPNVLAALNWIDQYGDRDGDGYVEYQTKSAQGLGNQCWRDSYNGVQYADGRQPFLPVATCELQGYVYDAKLRTAELAEGPMHDPALAARLRQQATKLRENFDRDFWIPYRGGYYALGLDGDKQQIDSMTSNMGHLLWSGILAEDRAAVVVEQLMSDAMFSGWGVRTTSARDQGFNPIGYHLGTVWPHDNSIIAAGLERYGYRAQANRIVLALIEAATFSQYRLPEAFSGYARSVARFPVSYPTACSPQAWATAAPLLLLRVMLGAHARGGRLTIDPDIPAEIGHVAIKLSTAFGSCWDIEAHDTTGTVSPAVC